MPDAVDTVVCAPDVWKYHPKHVEQFPDISKLCNVASCWIYIGILLGGRPILHISRIKVNTTDSSLYPSSIFDMIYLLGAIGLPPGGSSTLHIYTQTVHRTTQSTQTVHRTKQFAK
jgi:hypothetical protein